jgi:hypothetical protein
MVEFFCQRELIIQPLILIIRDSARWKLPGMPVLTTERHPVGMGLSVSLF